MSKFFVYFLYSVFIFIFVAVVFYGFYHLIGIARPLDITDAVSFSALVILASSILGAAGAAGWLRRKK
ncbi:MAG: hypothetical protein DHS20C05_11340 [Hyphococcus sp.]|nr:MAG: hypothetical protein DHS20C05_11340 [Marinicaulis sp.]